MRKYLLSSLLLSVTVCVLFLLCPQKAGAEGLFGKTKMSTWLKIQHEQQQEAVKKNGGPLHVKGRPVREYIMTLVQSTDGAQIVREKGGVVWQDFGGGICAAFLPMDSLDVLDQSTSILRMEANEPSKVMNDTSAVIVGVDKAWEGVSTTTQLPQAFTGKGVIASVMDQGFDFTHPAFRHEDGTSRVKWFWDPLAANDNPDELGKIYTSPEEVLAAQHSRDAETENHGSHVMGTMAGDGLNGRYVGMAPEADIMSAILPMSNIPESFDSLLQVYVRSHFDEDLSSTFLKVHITNVPELVELYKIFEQADVAGKPCVVNWSFGGAANFYFDGTLFEQVVNMLVGPGRIVVAAAGNSGDYFYYLKKETGTPMEQDIFWTANNRDNFFLDMRTDRYEPFFKFSLLFDGVDEAILFETEEIYKAALEGNGLVYDFDEFQIFVILRDGSYDKFVYRISIEPKGDYADSIRKGKTLIARTSHQPEPEFSGTDKNVYYGWGEIDAYAGLLDILGIETSIPELSKHQPAGITFRLQGRTLFIEGLKTQGTPLTVYDLSGRPVLQSVVSNGTIELSALPDGVYAVQLGRLGSTLIRL